MNCVKLYKLYQLVPSPLKVLDKLLFLEPFIEKFSTFEMKCLLLSYTIVVGVFFDKRVNKIAKKIWLTYHIGCTLLVWGFCGFYLIDLRVYDVRTVTLGVIPLIMTTVKIFIMIFCFNFFEVIEKCIQFLIDDYDRTNSPIPSDEKKKGCISVKKWVIAVSCIFLGFQICADVFFDIESQMKMINFTKRPHLMKFFPVWCPFENLWVKKAVSIFQDVIVLPEMLIFFFGSMIIFISSIQMHNKFKELFAKLQLLSERTFERIEILDKQLEEVTHISNERVQSSITKGLNEERLSTIATFYQDFVSCVERYQQLQRVQLLVKEILDYCCSILYCFTLSVMIGFGFTASEALSNVILDIESIIKTLIWFSGCGIIWCMICVVGDLFSRQNDLLAEEVYSMPWYHFSPKHRKTVLTLLTIIQTPTYLRAMKLVNVKKDTFPDFLNFVYSYVQTMGTLQSVRYRKSQF